MTAKEKHWSHGQSQGMQPQINDMERRLGIMQSVEPVLENAIKTLQKVVDVRGMGKK